MEGEVWQEIGDYYKVSDQGHVRSYKNGRYGRRDEFIVLLPDITSKGYSHVTLHTDKGNRRIYIHQLVLEAFVGSCPEGMECRHLDGDPGNNRLDNLEWATHQVNQSDKVGHGTHPTAIRPSAQLVTEIKKRHKQGESNRSIAEDLGFSPVFVKSIIENRHWSQKED